VLWGESAGAAAVTAHLSMPKSYPYFHKAIMESSTFNGWSYKSAQHAKANSAVLAHNLHCTFNKTANGTVTRAINVTCLLEKDIDEIVMLDDDGAGEADNGNGLPYMDKIDRSLWSVCIDGVNLMDTPANVLAAGKAAKVPMLFGTNRDEGSTFTYNQTGTGYSQGPDPASMYDGFLFSTSQLEHSSHTEIPVAEQNFTTGLFVNESEYQVWARNFFAYKGAPANLSSELANLYRPIGSVGGPAPAFNPEGIYDWWWSMSRTIGDYALSCPARRAARLLAKQGLDAYVFHFNHTPAISVNQAGTGDYGAFHGSEVPFVFYDTFELIDADEQQLSAAMVQYWAGFAWNGDPNLPPPNMEGGLKGLPQFPKYSTADDRYIILGDTFDGGYPNITAIAGLKEVECDWWDAYGKM